MHLQMQETALAEVPDSQRTVLLLSETEVQNQKAINAAMALEIEELHRQLRLVVDQRDDLLLRTASTLSRGS